jgi:hypothetical protein
LKDSEHDHTQRCLEYTVRQFWKSRPAGKQRARDIQPETCGAAEQRAMRAMREITSATTARTMQGTGMPAWSQ